MVQTRSMTRGNTGVNLSRLKENISSLNPMALSTLNNAVARNGKTPLSNELNANEERSVILPHKLERLSNILANNINANQDLRTITPYIDRAELIWSSLLLYPNGERKEDVLTYSTKIFKRKNTAMHNALLKIWKEYYTNDYKIEDTLDDMVNDMLWNTGSSVKLTLSRLNIDYLINGMELVGRNGKESLSDEMVQNVTRGNFIYDKQKDKFLVINKGTYVSPPTNNKVGRARIHGMESLFEREADTATTEFDILKGSKLEGTGFSITLTDNPAILADTYLLDKRKNYNEMDYSGNEDFGSMIKGIIGNEKKGSNQPDVPSNEEAEEFKKKNGGKDPKEPKAQTINMDVGQINTIQRELFPVRRTPNMFIQYVKQDIDFAAENYGRPIEFDVPSCSIVPIYLNGNVKKKRDYIILFDPDTGGFLNPVNDFQYYQSRKQGTDKGLDKNRQGTTNAIIDNLKTVQQGKECNFDMSEFTELANSILVEQFMKSCLSGRSGSISVEIDEEVNKIFLARMFRGQGIRCLYVPGEYVTYAAFKYNRQGIGQSLTQTAKMHIARLAAMDLADTMANMEMAQSTNKMRIAIDKDDPTPENTIAIAREVFFRANPRFYNVLATSQMSIPILVDAFKELSLTLEIDAGDNPHLPVPSVEITPLEKSTFRRVDPDSRNEVLNKISNFFVLPKSWLDVSDDNNNFQIEALTEHRLVYNQAVNWQNQLGGFIIEREVKHARNNRPFLRRLVQCIHENKNNWKTDDHEELQGSDEKVIEIILNDFLNSLTCQLPMPSAMENVSKIKDGLGIATDLVTQWKESSGASAKGALIGKALEAMGLSEVYSKEDIENMISSSLMKKAHKLLNIPMPFEDATDEGSGGIASMVEDINQQNMSVYAFIANLVEKDSTSRVEFLKKNLKKVTKNVDKLNAAIQPPEEDNPEEQNSDDLNNGDDTAGTDNNDDNFNIDDNPSTTDDTQTDDKNANSSEDDNQLSTTDNQDDENKGTEEDNPEPEENADDKGGEDDKTNSKPEKAPKVADSEKDIKGNPFK